MSKLTTAAPPVTPKERHYLELFAEYERRDLSLARFAEEKGIPAGTPGWWRKEIRNVSTTMRHPLQYFYVGAHGAFRSFAGSPVDAASS